ncbi:MAG: Rrf2 family transcriptional regulator [Bacteroidetes bacterium]|nr:Rrf2 family transcriptional regulator [Bacteroidota bacterium]
MLSLSCKASIKAVVFLGSKLDTDQKFSIREIAKFIDENEHTVAKLLQKLVKENIINSAKGPNGGFYITAKQKNLHVISIVNTIDGEQVFDECGLGLLKCSEFRPCPIHEDFKVVREKFKKICVDKRICDLYEGVNSGLSYLT